MDITVDGTRTFATLELVLQAILTNWHSGGSSVERSSAPQTRFDQEGVDEVDSLKSKCGFFWANSPKTVVTENSDF